MATYHLSHVATNTALKWLLNTRNPEGKQDLTTGRFLLSYGRPYRLMIATLACSQSPLDTKMFCGAAIIPLPQTWWKVLPFPAPFSTVKVQ
jgi:hypothetical protein